MDHPEGISKPFLQELLEKEEPGLNVTDFQVSAGSGRGDNYTAMLYRVRVNGNVQRDGSSQPWSRPLIYKCLPENAVRRDAFKSDSLFQNEVAVYTLALPTLLQFQCERKFQHPFTAVPKCYLAKREVLVLEDLRARGFTMADRRAGLDKIHLSAVLEKLARFHGLSLAMRILKPEYYEKNINQAVGEVWFNQDNEEYYKEYYRIALTNAINMVERQLSPEERVHYMPRLKTFFDFDTFFSSMVDLAKHYSPLTVLCHGDCWTNNIMYHYTLNGDIDGVCLLDFQLARHGSVALDLVNLLYCCATKELRKRDMTSLLESYCSTLHQTLLDLGCTKFEEYENLWKILQEEIHRYGRYGLGLAVDMIPISTCASHLAPDVYEKSIDDPIEEATPLRGCEDPVTDNSELCRQRMTDLVKELIDADVL